MVHVDRAYMENHLLDYILFQVQQGYPTQEIRKVLTKYGYPSAVVASVFHKLDPLILAEASGTRIKKKYNIAELTKEIHDYLLNMLLDYITKEKAQGYSIPVIKRALLKYGHNKEIVEEALALISKGKVVSYHFPNPFQIPQNIVFACCLVLLFGFLVFLSIGTNTSLTKVLLSFAPSIISFILMHALLSLLLHRRLATFLPLLSLALTAGLFVGSLRLVSLFSYASPQVLLVLNVIISFAATILLCLFSKKREAPVILDTSSIKHQNSATVHQKNSQEQEKVMRSETDAPLADLIREEMQRVDGYREHPLSSGTPSKTVSRTVSYTPTLKSQRGQKQERIPLRDV